MSLKHVTLTDAGIGYDGFSYAQHTCTVFVRLQSGWVVAVWMMIGAAVLMLLAILAVLRLVGSERAERTDRIVRRKKQRETDRLTRVAPPAAEQPRSDPG